MIKNDKKSHKNSARVETKQNEDNYFSFLSIKYNNASNIIFVLLVVVFVITLIFNSQLLTYTNFNYLFRDINSAAEAAGDNYKSISYTNDELRVVKKYRGGIITASSNDVAIYTATGRRTLFKSESFCSPQISASKKYAIVYELGAKKYNVYNSFAKVGGDELKHSISYATVADNGWFAVVTRDTDHTSVVYLYDDDMNLKNTYSFANANVFMVDIDANGKKIAIFKTSTNIDKFATEIMVCESGKKDILFDTSVSNGIVCGGGFTENGNIQLVATDGYFLLDDNGRVISHSLFDYNISRVSVASNGCAVALTCNKGEAKNKILVFDQNGKSTYDTEITGSIIDMEYYDGFVFINQGDTVLRLHSKKDISTVKLSDEGGDIIVYDSNNILLCCQTKAKYIKT